MIGVCNCICEYVMINFGIVGGGGIICIGDDGLFLVGSYVVYDC